MAGKQAKTLSAAQIRTAIGYLGRTRNSARDTVMFLLSLRAGLRAKEIAGATWMMVLDADGEIGDSLALEDRVAKMRSGRRLAVQDPLSHCVD